jgi:predicted transcriptional regulator
MSDQPPKTKHLTSREAARFFIRPMSIRNLYPFMERDMSLSEAAEKLGISKSHMGYWLKKLLELDLIQKVRVEKRGKYNVPLYRATANSFTVPLSNVPASSYEDILHWFTRDFNETERHSIIHSATKTQGWHIRLSREDQKTRLQLLPASGQMEEAKILNKWGYLELNEKQAKTFRTELKEMLERYASSQTKQGKKHLFKFLLVEAKID